METHHQVPAHARRLSEEQERLGAVIAPTDRGP